MSTRRILVVENDDDSARMLELLLQLDGHEVLVACDGETALEQVKTFRPGAVLIDLGLPGMDGLELSRRLRAMSETSEALLVAITGAGEPEDRQRTREAGFHHHIVKPLDPEALGRLLT